MNTPCEILWCVALAQPEKEHCIVHATYLSYKPGPRSGSKRSVAYTVECLRDARRLEHQRNLTHQNIARRTESLT